MTSRRRLRAPRLSHDQRVLVMALASALPGALVALILLWTGAYTAKVQWTLTVLIVDLLASASPFALRERVVAPLQTLSNLLAALRRGRLLDPRPRRPRRRPAGRGDARGQRPGRHAARASGSAPLEASTLLRKVMEEIDVAVFTFDDEQRLQLVNRAGSPCCASRWSGCSTAAPTSSGSPRP